ncbi:TetR/AcrR family transcriptional regulator [Kordiimonas sp. SCSIO 12610]|uniref:TetR/AcrR family transcriptional regulator n=1 Tax=Kordiimonas sp. SCSIO 12610 TaxID=2829597 RepID=UPI00210CCE67|nr:TetR/AcrR family transcriptional regulator [Kordiimonas sp. SCSIO 12610]UTW56395.1 TetR/AcrR family transcriptional regulator [Kordiimonas sp. SCSIO 12610]
MPDNALTCDDQSPLCKPARGRPRSDAKNLAIMEAASQLFMENGFDGTSMDEVAKRAGVSKQTVYSHFANKEQLFSAAIRGKIAEYFPDSLFQHMPDHTLEDDFRIVCRTFCALLVSEDAIAMFRVLTGAAAKNSNLAKIFWDAGPEDMLTKLIDFLQSWIDRGELEIKDTERAATQLISLLKGNLHFQLAIGLVEQVSNEEIEHHVNECMSAFLKIYRA